MRCSDVSIRHGRRTVLSDLHLEVGAGRSAAIMGRSGSGKSSLLGAVLGMVPIASGRIEVGGRDVTSLRGAQRREYLRRVVSVVFQHGELLEELEPVENVAIAAILAGMDRTTAFRDAGALLSNLEVPVRGVRTQVLSGGEQQRVAVARALITRPSLVLADEPTGSLDAEFREMVGDLVLSIPERWGSSVLVVTHDDALARRADDTYRLVPDETGIAHLEPAP